jgi:hypothetical protein
LSIVTGKEPPILDLLAFQRGGAAPDLEELNVNPLTSSQGRQAILGARRDCTIRDE